MAETSEIEILRNLKYFKTIGERISKIAEEQREIANSTGTKLSEDLERSSQLTKTARERILKRDVEHTSIINSTEEKIVGGMTLWDLSERHRRNMDQLREQLSGVGKLNKMKISSESEKSRENEVKQRQLFYSLTLKKLLEDFKGLLDSGENSDVKLVVSGKEFLAHRLILCTRSPVFKAMLCHDTSERDSGTVDIDDCDPDTFQDFLDYVYTGSTEHVNIENMISLYATSDKYLMLELKAVCVSFMKANMSVEKFCDIANVALLYAEEDLLEFSKDFFFKNSKNIIDSKNWDAFFKENPKEAYEHFMKPLISRR